MPDYALKNPTVRVIKRGPDTEAELGARCAMDSPDGTMYVIDNFTDAIIEVMSEEDFEVKYAVPSIPTPATSIKAMSPNGQVWDVTVSNVGTIKAVKATS